MKLELSKQEWIWLYNYIGECPVPDVSLQIFRRMKDMATKINQATELHKRADELQLQMQDCRQRALTLESQI